MNWTSREEKNVGILKIRNNRKAELQRLRESERALASELADMRQIERARQKSMDRISLGECLRMNQVLGWTVMVESGHVTKLGRL